MYKNEYEVVNRSGAVVDVAALAAWEDPYGAELRRRTEGLETEEELLGFLNGLEGQWGSRRKKRKIVDAGDFGDELPVGWKLLLGLKRREGRASLNCRRYIRLVFSSFHFSGHVCLIVLFWTFHGKCHRNEEKVFSSLGADAFLRNEYRKRKCFV